MPKPRRTLLAEIHVLVKFISAQVKIIRRISKHTCYNEILNEEKNEYQH